MFDIIVKGFMKKERIFGIRELLFVIVAVYLVNNSMIPVFATEVTYGWDEQTRVPTLRRKLPTAINIYTDGKSEDITHESGVLNGVIYDILRVTPTDHTRLQVDYSEQPVYLDELIDGEALDEGLLYAGGINGGYFSNNEYEYGKPVGAVRRNNAWTSWYGTENTPAYGNGFSTAYINGDDLSLKYHGWQWGNWIGDNSWHWSTGYTMDQEYAVSGSYTYFADGIQQDITNGACGDINYRTYGRAVTILAQKEDRQFMLITIYGTLSENVIVQFLTDLNVYDAIRLDGGGSTQMVYETTLVKEIDPELKKTEMPHEQMDGNKEVLGFATVKVDKLRVRAGAHTNSAVKDEAVNGERYQVYEIQKDSQYTWYRIGEYRWIAGTKQWVDYETTEEAKNANDVVQTVQVTVNVGNLNIRKTPSVSAGIIGTAVEGKTYTSTEQVTAYGYTWYKIGNNQWIASKDNWVSILDD